MSKGLLFVLSGPAGSGKGTVLEELRKKHPEIKVSISMTTRAPRGKEVPNVNYYYTTREDFEKRLENGEFFEYAEYSGNYYGTLNSEVIDCLDKGQDVILEIEVVGAKKVKEKYSEAITVMLTPPDAQTLENRLRGRKTEKEPEIQRRLAKAKEEITHLPEYDYSVVNEDGRAVECAELLYAIIQSAHRRTTYTKTIIEKFI
ncbi:MAG: guanylate kinase [Clostridia bacterium]|nr:guanylate kinase [Clostridia bacterium]